MNNTHGEYLNRSATLVNEHKGAGYHQVQWKADVPSGIYFYRMQAEDASTGSAQGFVERKMMLLK